MSTITNNIFSTISMLADKKITSFKPDKSVTGIIVYVPEDSNDFYRVQIDSVILNAKSIGNEQYNIGEIVYLLIPDNDLSNTKFILGSTTKKSSNLTEENPIDKQFSLLGTGVIFNKYLINSDFAFTPTISDTEGIKLYTREGESKTVHFESEEAKKTQFLEDIATLESKLKNDTTAFVVSAKIKTNFTSGINIAGAFGIKVKIKYTDGEREYKFSSSQMQAENVYQMLDYTEQKAAFENINNETFEYISEISVYSGLSQAYLYIKDLKLYGAKRVASSIPTYTLSIESINDLIDISKINNNGANIILQAVLKDSSQRVIQNTTYTWYQEDTTVADGASEKGGEGWALISGDKNTDNQLTISSNSQFTSTSCRFKCIATTSSGMSFDAYYTLYNTEGVNLSISRHYPPVSGYEKVGEIKRKQEGTTLYYCVDKHVYEFELLEKESDKEWVKQVGVVLTNTDIYLGTDKKYYVEVSTASGNEKKEFASNDDNFSVFIPAIDYLLCVAQPETTDLTYKWEKKLNNSNTWVDTGIKTKYISIAPESIYVNEIYRCTVSGSEDKYMGYAEAKVYNPKYEYVRAIELYYMRSNSYIDAPSASGEGWQKTIPEETNDKIWVWQKTVTIYEDGREAVNSIVQIKGIPGEAGVGQKEQLFLYAYTEKNEMPTAPVRPVLSSIDISDGVWDEGKCVYTFTEPYSLTKKDFILASGYCTYDDGTSQYPVSYSLANDSYSEEGNLESININKGEGHPDDKKDFTATLFYYKAQGLWQFNTQPVTKDLPYQWKYTFIIYTDDTYVTDGPTLEAIWVDGIKSIETQWAASNDGSTAPDKDKIGVEEGGWTSTFSDVASTDKQYIWVRELITYKSGATEPTTPRVDLANNAIKNWAITTDQTYINGAKIYTGTIDASKISVDDLSATNATIGGWTINQESLYNDGLLISTKDGDSVQRIAAAGKNSIINPQDITRTLKMVAAFNKSNMTDSRADYFATIVVPPYIEVFNENTLAEVHITYLTTASASGLWTDTIPPNTDYIEIDPEDRTISYKLTHEPSVTKIEFIIQYTVNEVQSIGNPVFELLSDGTGTIGGWNITQDGLENIAGNDKIQLTVNAKNEQTVIIDGEPKPYYLKIEQSKTNLLPILTGTITEESDGSWTVAATMTYPYIDSDFEAEIYSFYISSEKKTVTIDILNAETNEWRTSAYITFNSFYSSYASNFINVSGSTTLNSGDLVFYETYYLEYEEDQEEKIKSYEDIGSIYLLKEGTIVCKKFSKIKNFDVEYLYVDQMIRFPQVSGQPYIKPASTSVDMYGKWTISGDRIITEKHYNELKKSIDALIDKVDSQMSKPGDVGGLYDPL